MVISFGGCSWFSGGSSIGGSGGSSGGGAYDPNDKIDSAPLPGDSVVEELPEGDINQTVALAEASGIQGVRATYLPDVNERSEDAVLQADREKYLENAAFQYEIVAEYILHTLQGKYGSGVSASSIKYEFYADTSLTGTFYEGKEIRNEEDRTEQIIELPAIAPEEDADYPKTFGTTENAINEPVVNVELEYTEVPPGSGSACPPARPVTDASLHWIVTGNDIRSYKSVVQLNLMELALGLPTSPITTNEITATNEIKNLAKRIDKLGIIEKGYYAQSLRDYIANNLIGANLISRDKASLSYVDPSYTYYEWEQVGTDEDGNPIYDWVAHTGYYEMLGSGTPHAFTSSIIYKFGYEETIDTLVSDILGTYDGDTLLSAGFVHTFPKYTRVEIADLQPYNFIYSEPKEELEEGERQHITSMDYREYNSVIIYPNEGTEIVPQDESIDTFADEETGEQPENKNWLFDLVEFRIDSVQDITLDIYLRVHYGSKVNPDGTTTPAKNVILHITRICTDSTKDQNYYPGSETDWGNITDDENWGNIEIEIDEDGNIKLPEDYGPQKEDFFDTTKTNYRLVDLAALTESDDFDTFVNEINNPYTIDDPTADSFRQFFHEVKQFDEENKPLPVEYGTITYHNVFAGKLGSNLSIDTPSHLEYSLGFENYFGDMVSLNDKYLCQEDCDFVEFIFDVQKDPQLGANYDYSFKFSISMGYTGMEDNDFEFDTPAELEDIKSQS